MRVCTPTEISKSPALLKAGDLLNGLKTLANIVKGFLEKVNVPEEEIEEIIEKIYERKREKMFELLEYDIQEDRRKTREKERKAREKARKEGREEGKKEGIQLTKKILYLSAQGYSEYEIAEELKVSEELIWEILKN